MVSEADARGVPGAENDCCLICETESTLRRIWHYPADWHRLDDEKLIALFDAPFRSRESSRAAARHEVTRDDARACSREA